MTCLASVATTPAQASEIRYIVNNVPVTSYDIARRKAFLRLQRRSANASDEMIEQTLKNIEINRLNIRVPDADVDAAYGRFASGNKLSKSQLDQIMAQSGVTKSHFKDFIRSQIGWNRALGARFRATERLTEQDAAHRMLQDGGNKPTATEYMLQQVIFVIPSAERKSLLSRRKKEANAMRGRFNNCQNTREFAKGLVDVTVRDLGRVIAPELPPDWKSLILETKPGQATKIRETERGVEFIGICSTREISDDRVAQMVFENEGELDKKAAELSEKYLKELREKASIIER
ncbi:MULTISPECIES: peptidylprolyl isomerase [Nitratireductor]|uniref:peptidylprolyl isomerase n=2 Tax=Nitratireductor TaxID=245876 RepID=UPI000FDB14F4|nr:MULTISPECIES: peptidylprolyl isomerase [Nitratireductor]